MVLPIIKNAKSAKYQKVVFLSVISKNDTINVKNIGIIHATKLNIPISIGNHSKGKGLGRITSIRGVFM